ncbi:MAG: HAMP domain-containing protein, partial [Gammaproteobacteria bacterium]
MKFSIGHRLFAAVLLAILAVTATGIVLMRQNLVASFSTYAVEIELDRLQQLSNFISQQYVRTGGWRFLPADSDLRRDWIGMQLVVLQDRFVPAPPLPPAPPTPPAPPRPDEHAVHALPPLPPLPSPHLEVRPLPGARLEVDMLALQDRISLTDAAGRYLAGRVPQGEAGARRAVTAGGRTIGYLSVARAARPSDAMAAAFLDRLGSSLLIVVGVSIVLSAAAGMLLAAHFRKPIGKLADGARALAEGDYTARIAVERSDELGELAARFNRMAEQLGQLEASRRQWVADTSHELRTPLSVLRAQLEAIQDGVRAPTAEHLDAMLRQVLALNKLIDELHMLAQADVGQLDYRMQAIDAWELCVQAASMFRPRFEAAGLALEVQATTLQATVLADPDRLHQV